LGFSEQKAMDFLHIPESLALPFHIYYFLSLLVLGLQEWKLQESLWEKISVAAILCQKKALASEISLCYQWHWSMSTSVCLYK